jgi:WD40 repeat protein
LAAAAHSAKLKNRIAPSEDTIMRKPSAFLLVVLLAALVSAAPAPLVSEPKVKEIVMGPESANGVAVFSPDGKTLVTPTAQNTVCLWDTTTGKEIRTFKGHNAAIEAVAISADGSRLVSGGVGVNGWDNVKGNQTYGIGFGGKPGQREIRSLLYASDGALFGCGTTGGLVYLFDSSNGIQKMALNGHTKTVTALAFSADGKALATASEDGSVRLWDVTTGKEAQKLEGHAKPVRGVALSADGKKIASCGDDATIRLWEAATGKLLQTLEGHKGTVNAVAFSPDGRSIASAGADQTAQVWDATTGRQLFVLKGHTDAVRALSFSADGKLLTTWSPDKTLRVWELK